MSFIKTKKQKKDSLPKDTNTGAKKSAHKTTGISSVAPHIVIKRPWVSEKSQRISAFNQYVFLVEPSANKHMVRQEVQKRYDVQVMQVDVTRLKGKVKRFRNQLGKRAGLKKAIVTLKEGQKIETE